MFFFLLLNRFDSTQLPNIIKCYLIVVASNFSFIVRLKVFITVHDANTDHLSLNYL